MKLSLLFAIVVFVGVALANDIPQKKSAHANLAHSKHSRAQKVRSVASKRDLSSEYDLLNCIILKFLTQSQQTSGSSENQSGCPIDRIMDLANQCCAEQDNSTGDPNGSTDISESEDTSTAETVESEEGTDEGDDYKRRKLNHQKRHKARSHHAKAARAHVKKQ